MDFDMDMGKLSAVLAIRSSFGIELWTASGAKSQYEHKDHLPREETKSLRSCAFSPSGQYFAYSNGNAVKIFNASDWSLKSELPRPKAFYLNFSPRGNFLCTWELYTVTKDKPEGSPNMFVYEVCTGNELFSIVQKKQSDWEPSWAADESIFACVIGGEALFYDLTENGPGFKSTSRKIGGIRGGMLSLSPGNCPPFLAFYTPGTKGGPSMCKLYRYPNLAQNQIIACKSFFQADRVDMLWNKRGTGLLLLTSTEVDKSGASYYGNQALHFMTTKGESCSVPLSKDGPVHCVKWNPKANEFLVVYGFMPSKASLYNLKCDVIFDFGEGPRNSAYFNPFGNVVVLAGFGNLPGNVEIWDVKKRELIANIKCPDTTYFDWNPNGEYFLTATTSPRLRIGNGFKVYHYSGALMHETIWPKGKELLGVEWQTFSEGIFTEQPLTKKKQEGIKSSQPEASKKAYTPPHLRLMKEGKNPDAFLPQPSKNQNQTAPGRSSQSNRKTNFKTNNTAINNCNNASGVDSCGNMNENCAQKNKKNKGKKGKKDTAISTNAPKDSIMHTKQQHNANQNVKQNLSKEQSPQTQKTQTLQFHEQPSQFNVEPERQACQTQFHNLSQAQFPVQQQTLQYQAQFQQDFVPLQQDTSAYNQYSQNCPSYNPKISQQFQPYAQNYTPEFSQGYNTAAINSAPGFVSQHLYYTNTISMSRTSMPSENVTNVQNLGSTSLDKAHTLTCEAEKEKKIRNVTRKLSDIKKLKERQSQGETLELNQLDKILMEAEFTQELKSLTLSA